MIYFNSTEIDLKFKSKGKVDILQIKVDLEDQLCLNFIVHENNLISRFSSFKVQKIVLSSKYSKTELKNKRLVNFDLNT